MACKCDCEGKGNDVVYGLLLLSLALMTIFTVGLAYDVSVLRNQTEELKGIANHCEQKTSLLWVIASHEGKLKGWSNRVKSL